MRWFEKNVEGCLQHWFGSLTVVYDGDPNALSSAAAPGTTAVAAAPGTTAVAAAPGTTAVAAAAVGNGAKAEDSTVKAQEQSDEQQQQQQQQRYIFGFQPHGLYPTGA